MSQETKPDYFQEALYSRLHRAVLTVVIVLGGFFAWRHLWSLLLAALAAEALFLLIAPKHPAFRSACDAKAEAERARKRAALLSEIAGRLSPAAKLRYEGVTKLRDKILDTLRTQPQAAQLEQLWEPRLRMLREWALRLLVSIDASRLTARDQQSLEEDIRQAELEVEAAGADESARQVKESKLKLAKDKLERSVRVRQRREAAIVQLEAVEGVLEDLISQGLKAGEEDAFAGRLELIGAQVQALGDSLESMSKDETASYQLSSAKSLAGS